METIALFVVGLVLIILYILDYALRYDAKCPKCAGCPCQKIVKCKICGKCPGCAKCPMCPACLIVKPK